MLKVIIADDEVRICKLLRILVDWNALGFEIAAEEHDGLSLIARVRELKPSLVITDIRMPGLSGLELLHKLREEGNNVEVLIMSGYREFDYVHNALKDGASDYLLKPINKNVLEEALNGVRKRVHEDLKMESEREQAREVLEYASAQRGKELIQDVLEGSLKKADRDRLNREYRCDFQKGPLFFVTLKSGIRDFGMEKAAALLNRKYSGQLENFFHGTGRDCACLMQGNCHYILTEAETESGMEDQLYDLLRSLRPFLSQVESSFLAAGICRVDPDDLPGSLRKSREAMLDHFYTGTGKVAVYTDFERVNPDRIINIRSASQIQQALTNCGERTLESVIKGLLREIREFCDPIHRGANAAACIDALQKQLQHVTEHLHVEEEIRSIPERYLEMTDCCGDFGTVVQMFCQETKELEDHILQLQERKEKKPVRQLRQLIQERYMKPLSLEDLAEELQMTPAYVSRMFKKEIGENLTVYVNSVRLEKAKEMLAMTDEPISVIALATGFSDEKYFMRLFKKEVGLTAGEYRRLYGE